MSIKFDIWMIVFAPYYLFKILICGNSIKFKSFSAVYFIFCISNWCYIFIMSQHKVIGFISANLGIVGLLIGNIYSHVTSESEIVDEKYSICNIIFDILVGIGSIVCMLLFVYMPSMIFKSYLSGESKYHYNFSVLSISIIIIIFQIIYILFNKELFLNFPKDPHGMTKNNDRDYNVLHIVVIYMIGLCIFYSEMNDAYFMSTLKPYLSQIF